MSRVLGVDPGLHETGWAVLDGAAASPRLVASGVVRTLPGVPLPQRLKAIHAGLAAVIAEHAPESCAMEEMFFTTVAVTVRATLQARGVALLAVAQAGRLVHEYNPKTVKLSLTGSGSAEKAQMQTVVQKALGLTAKLRPNDVADAAAIALCHMRTGRLKGMKVLDAWGAR
ncbi:MAG: crossover junction endodeoxyribonuclease RuvC [Elusimicrobia bacterium RIFOXYD12_FULL_66_9]|nr:MAG: crossover junction endodeoxyribonuclease RuvC [Elusimicrobia bacterium RIFOXYD12_FULL_66_9]